MGRFPAGWNVDEDGKRVSIEVETEDFMDAVDLIDEMAPLAEGLEHHPDIHLERWNHVRIVSYSHDVGTLTERDEQLVALLHKLLQRRGLA